MMTQKIAMHLILIAMLAVPLSGCKESLEHWFNAETYAFNGLYANQFNHDTLVFRNGIVRFKVQGKNRELPFRVDGSEVAIQLRNSSKEKRADLVMRIHGSGEVLTCSACAMYRLSNVWIKENKDVPNKYHY